MNPFSIPAIALAGAIAFLASTALAQSNQEPPIYGGQLMTPEERAEHREKMRSADSPTERQAIRQEHYETMRRRAEERGMDSPDAPMRGGLGAGGQYEDQPAMGPGGRGMGMGGGRARDSETRTR